MKKGTQVIRTGIKLIVSAMLGFTMNLGARAGVERSIIGYFS